MYENSYQNIVNISKESIFLNGQSYKICEFIKTESCNVVYKIRDNEKFYIFKMTINKDENIYYDKLVECLKLNYEKMNTIEDDINVPRIYNFYENIVVKYNSSCCYDASAILMEYINGTNLSSIYQSLKEQDLCKVSKSIISTIKYCNDVLHFFHLDISPRNIIMTGNQVHYLIDFTGAFCPKRRNVSLFVNSIIDNFPNNESDCIKCQAKMIFNNIMGLSEHEYQKLEAIINNDDPLDALTHWINSI